MPPLAETLSPNTRFYRDEQPFPLEAGGSLPGLELAYETWGQLDADRGNAVLLFTGLSPSAHAASSKADDEPGWWEAMIGPGKPIDTRHWFVLCVNSLGSCKGSLGPASDNPATGRPWRLDFPELRIEDIAGATQRVVAQLGIERVAVAVGPSMGGMSALAWLQQNPKGARHLVSLSSAARAEPFSIAIRSLQREAIVNDPDFADGQYTEEHWPRQGMRMARKLGMLSYRSAVEWVERFGRERQDRYPQRPFTMSFSVESYLEAAAERFIGTFDPCCYLYLSRAMDAFDAFGGKQTLADALGDVRLESALVTGVETDLLFPLRQQEEIAVALEQLNIDTQLERMSSVQGHDAFLVDYEHFGNVLGKHFRAIARRE